MKDYFVTAIDTDAGKTLVSAILLEALGGDYYKPVQCGTPRDIDTVKRLVTSDHQFFPPTYDLALPASPHLAAQNEGVQITLDQFRLPKTDRPLIVEGAGGILVPLNDQDVIIDLAARWDLEIILVANLYLGSINHSLLTISELKRRGLSIKGIVFNGPPNHSTQEIILQKSGLPCLLHILPEAEINRALIQKYAALLAPHL